jgi:uncharacterized protein (TIGR03437 family)
MLQRTSMLLISLSAFVSCGQSLQAAVAALIFSPTKITVSGNSGGPAVTQTVTLMNTGDAATDWVLAVDSTAPWLTARPSSGKALAAGASVTITVTADPANLKPSSSSGYLANITPLGSDVRVPLSVTFNVFGASIAVTPNPLNLSVLAGTRQIFANVAQINGNGKVSITVTSGSWLTADSSAQALNPFSIIVDARELAASTAPYRGNLLIQCTNAPCIAQNVPVNVTVYSQLTLNCTPTAGPAQVGVAYSTTCAASGGNNSYLWSLGAGSLPPGVSLSSFTGSTIQVSGTPVAAGPYSYAISVSDRSPLAPQTISQTFKGTIAPPSPPTLSTSLSSLSFGSYVVGGTAPASQTISLSSASPDSGLAFTSTLGSDCAWLTLSPIGGSTPAIISATVDLAKATLGNHSCVITFNANGVLPAPTVTASLTLGAGNAPVISAIVNAAGFNPGGPITTGSWVAVFGANLAPVGDSRQWNTSTEIVNGAFPTSLDGTSITVNGKNAAVAFISPTQVNIQTPDDTAVGPVQVVISTTAGGASASFTSNYAQFAPGLFLATPSYLAVQHADGSYVGGYPGSTPAKPGEVITLWGTGFGPASPPVPAGRVFTGASKLLNDVTVMIGAQPAIVDFAGVVGAGLVQINVRVPSSINNGDAAVRATVNGLSTQASGNLIAIHD